ncbi:hypothetical protein Tco_1483604 [Tanacetum coccineum]
MARDEDYFGWEGRECGLRGVGLCWLSLDCDKMMDGGCCGTRESSGGGGNDRITADVQSWVGERRKTVGRDVVWMTSGEGDARRLERVGIETRGEDDQKGPYRGGIELWKDAGEAVEVERMEGERRDGVGVWGVEKGDEREVEWVGDERSLREGVDEDTADVVDLWSREVRRRGCVEEGRTRLGRERERTSTWCAGTKGSSYGDLLQKRVIETSARRGDTDSGERGKECGFDSKEDEVVPKVDDISLVDGVFDGALGGDGV